MEIKQDYISGHEFMRLPSLCTSKVLSNKVSLDVQIKGVNIIDVPDIVNWVQPGDIMITTAYPFRDDMSQILLIMESISKKGVSGIAIKSKCFIKTITKDMINKADECKLLLVELSPEAIFSNIIYETFQAISYKSIQRYIELQNRIDRLLFNMNNSDSLDRMLELLEEEIHRSIGILEEEGKLIRLPHILSQIMTFTEEHYNSLKQQAVYQNNVILNILDQQYRFYVRPLGNSESHQNYLIVDQTDNSLETFEKRVLENVLPILSIQLRNNQLLQRKVKKYRDRFLLDWAKGMIDDTMDIILFAREYDFNLNKDILYQVGIISILETEKLSKELSVTKMRHYVQSLKSQFLITFDGGELLIILEVQPNADNNQNIKRLLRELETAIGEKVRVALSNPQPLNQVSIAYTEARKVYDISKKLNVPKSIITLEDLGIFTVLSLLPRHDEVKQYVDRNLKNIKEYDQKNNSKLLETLNAYFETGGNAKKASERLYIHYNTMMYRLDKIKSILNRNIDDVEIRLQLQVALKIDTMYKVE